MTNKNISRLFLQAAMTPMLLAYGSSALAQPASSPGSAPATTANADTNGNALQEIVVTATKTGAQKLQTIPESISVATGSQIEKSGIQNIADLAQYIPNTSFGQYTSHAEIYIRGIGSNNTGVGSDPDVTTQIDGVYIARPSAQLMDFVDVDRVEVLRGPQGTLYGRNAVGGTINVVSRQPSDDFTGKVTLSGGNYGYFQGQGYVSGPLTDTLQASFAGSYERHDPYFTNIAPGGSGVGGDNSAAFKGQLRWEPTSDIDATTRADYSYSHQSLEGFSQLLAPVPFPSPANSIVGDLDKVDLNSPQFLRSTDWGISEEVNWRLNSQMSLKSITAFRVDEARFAMDADGTEENLQFLQTKETDQAVSQEFDLQYSSSRIKAVGGLYFFHDHDVGDVSIMVFPSVITPAPGSLTNGADSVVDSTSGAVFGQVTYNLTSDLSAVVGARYTLENKQLDQNATRTSLNQATLGATFPGFPLSFTESKDYHAFTPKFGLNWKINTGAMIYASITKGFKSGGFNYAATSAALAAFAPESIWSYELGAKTEWFDHRLRANIDGFYYSYTNLQVQQFLAPGVSTIGNAATATGRGVEAEFTATPVRALQLTANFSVLNARYDSYSNASVPQGLVPFVSPESCGVGVTGISCSENASGHQLNNAPSLGALGAADYKFEIANDVTVGLHIDYTWHDRTYFDPSNALILSQKAYGLLNGQVSLERKQWRFELFAKNIANVRYAVSESAGGIVPTAVVGDPRTAGARLSYAW